jgi:hypothetical protein
MLDQLMKLLSDQGQQHVVENPDVPNEHNQQILGEAGNSIFNGLQGALANGGLAQIMRLFSNSRGGSGLGGNSGGISSLISNPMVQNIIQSFVGRLTNQYKMSPAAAQNVGNTLIPNVLGGLVNQVNDRNNSSIDINSVMQSLTGGQTGGTDFSGILEKFSGAGGGGLDRDGDGDVDLQDLIGNVSNAARSQQSAGGGGIMDMISGFLTKA